jgi:hypothetical protein
MTRPDPSGRAPRYRVVVYELHDDNQTKIMDATTSGLIAAAATIHDGEMDITLADGGTHDLKQHIALFINNQYGT